MSAKLFLTKNELLHYHSRLQRREKHRTDVKFGYKTNFFT